MCYNFEQSPRQKTSFKVKKYSPHSNIFEEKKHS